MIKIAATTELTLPLYRQLSLPYLGRYLNIYGGWQAGAFSFPPLVDPRFYIPWPLGFSPLITLLLVKKWNKSKDWAHHITTQSDSIQSLKIEKCLKVSFIQLSRIHTVWYVLQKTPTRFWWSEWKTLKAGAEADIKFLVSNNIFSCVSSLYSKTVCCC